MESPVSWSQSAGALLDLLQQVVPYQNESNSLGPPPLLTAAHLLASALEALPDGSLSLLIEGCPDHLEALHTLVALLMDTMPLPHQSLPLPLHDDRPFHWAEQLLSSCNVVLRNEVDGLCAEMERQPGILPLVLCIAVHGLTALCAGWM